MTTMLCDRPVPDTESVVLPIPFSWSCDWCQDQGPCTVCGSNGPPVLVPVPAATTPRNPPPVPHLPPLPVPQPVQ